MGWKSISIVMAICTFSQIADLMGQNAGQSETLLTSYFGTYLAGMLVKLEHLMVPVATWVSLQPIFLP